MTENITKVGIDVALIDGPNVLLGKCKGSHVDYFGVRVYDA